VSNRCLICLKHICITTTLARIIHTIKKNKKKENQPIGQKDNGGQRPVCPVESGGHHDSIKEIATDDVNGQKDTRFQGFFSNGFNFQK